MADGLPGASLQMEWVLSERAAPADQADSLPQPGPMQSHASSSRLRGRDDRGRPCLAPSQPVSAPGERTLPASPPGSAPPTDPPPPKGAGPRWHGARWLGRSTTS